MRRAALLCGLMVASAIAAYGLRPRAGSNVKQFDLARLVPERFGQWEIDTRGTAAVVNPQTQELLNKLYKQLLSRTYVNAQKQRVMLSLAYGGDQRGSLEAHKPEVCYPAQGFKLLRTVDGTLVTAYGNIEVRRLDTVLGARREPLTYWFTVGEATVANRWQKRMAELRMSLTGQVPDGLLFRVSSLDSDADRAWQLQQGFVADLLGATNAADRRRLAGLESP